MYNNPKQLSDTLLEAMQIISNNNISKTDYGTTIQGNIVECKDPSIGKYLVKYQDSLMEAYSTSPSVQYPKNTTVYLFATNGRLGDLKIILGSTKQLGSNYIEEYMGQEYYDTSNNFIEDNDYVIELCSYQTKEQDIYSIEENENKPNVISLSDNIIQRLQNSNYLKISGTIQTNLSYKQKYYGRYGVRITLLMKNSATGNTEEQNYYFDSNNFNGNPYEYRVPSTQSVSYPIDSANFIAVSRITAFIQGFPNQIQEGAEAPAADIFISNLTLNGSYRLSETEKNTIGVILTAPKGYIFTKDNVLTDTRPIKAGLRAKMKQVDLEAQGAQVYWFKEDLNINTMSPGYLRIGGLGWRCINPASATDNPLVYQFEPSITIDIKKEDVQFTKESKFKCVIRYDNKSYTKQFIIFNNGASRQVTLESTAGTSFSCSAGHPNLICRIWETSNEGRRDITEEKDKDGNKIFTFKWQVCNSQNVTKVLEQDSEEEIQEYEEDKRILEEINAILNGTKEEPKEESDDDENSYKKTLKARLNINKEVDQIPYEEFIEALQERIRKYEGDQHIDGNILYSLDLHQIIDFSVFKCSCYEEDTCYGTANITIKNTQIPNDGYVLTINNGDQVFLYNEEGTSLHSVGLDQPYSIRDLSFSLFHNGEEISQEDLKNGVAPTWKVPLKDTMLEIGATENSSDENYKYIIGQTLPIDVKNVYNPSLSNNDIYLILRYKDLVLTTKTNFGFSKEGELGTNGTKYQFKITTDTPILRYNVYREEGKERQGWEKDQITLTPELWCNGQKQSEIEDEIKINWNILKNNLNKDKNGKLKEWSYLNSGKDKDKKRIIDLENEGILNIPNQNLVNIIQATLTGPEGYKYYSVLPFISVYEYFDNTKYQVQFNLDSGFRTAVYKSDGTQPKYDSRSPFKVNIYKKFANGNERENITLQKKENFTFNWKVTDEEDLAGFKTDSINKYRVEPKSILKNGNRVTDGVLLQIKKGEEPFAYVHIPIYLMLNRYENAAMNDWDGTSIEINDKNGYILTPQVGAGRKENNAFTGVLLGIERIKTENNNIEDNVGLFGYAAGARSIFLDAKTGSAEFGLPDKGQIIIDVKDQAIIKSGDYQIPSSDKNRTEEDKNKKGMQIQFSGQPHIYFSSGNFMVDSSGRITARGGGNIAGWQITDDRLFKNTPANTEKKVQGAYVEISSSPTREAFRAGVRDSEKDTLDINFYVTHKGYLFSKKGQIAGWNITEKMLNKKYDVEIKNEKGEVKQSIEYSVGMQSGQGLSFWAGPTGDYNFSVKSNGYLFSKSGNIGGWKIFADKLTNEAENVGISSGIKLDNDDIRTVCFWSGNKNSSYSTENMNFYVDTTGFLFSKYGQIGNWFIGSGGLYHQLGKAKIEITLPYSYNKRIIRLRQERDKTTKKGTEEYDNFNKRIKKIQKDIKDGKIKRTDRAVETITTKTFDNTIDINYENSQGGVYVGSDGIRLGEIFHVDSNGLYASKGNIGGIDITLDGLYATNWQITGDGTATFAGATINGSSINKALAISGSSGGGGISGGGMHMGASGSGPGSSSISPDVMAQGKGKTWDAYIDEKIKNAIDSMSKSAVIKALKDGGSSIDFRDLTVTAEKFNGHNMEKSGSDLATESYVDSKIKSVTPTTPTTPTTP